MVSAQARGVNRSRCGAQVGRRYGLVRERQDNDQRHEHPERQIAIAQHALAQCHGRRIGRLCLFALLPGMDRLRPIVIFGMCLWGKVAHIYRLARSSQLTARRGGSRRCENWGHTTTGPIWGLSWTGVSAASYATSRSFWASARLASFCSD